MNPRAELLARIDDVAYARVRGATFADVVALAAEKGWGLSRATLRRYVAAADRRVAREQRRADRSVEMHRARREMVYARAVLEGDYKVALAALKDLALIDGVYPAKRAGRGESPGPLVNLNLTVSDEQRRVRILEAIEQGRAEEAPGEDDAGGGGGVGASPGAGPGEEGAAGV